MSSRETRILTAMRWRLLLIGLIVAVAEPATAEICKAPGVPPDYQLARLTDDALIELARSLTPLCCAEGDCCARLHAAEAEARGRVLLAMAKLEKIEETKIADSELDALAKKVEDREDLLKQIKRFEAVLPRRPDPKNGESFYDFERRFVQFYAGGEVPPDDLGSVKPIVGILVQTRFWESKPECRAGFGFYGLHNTLRAALESSRESRLFHESELNEDGTPKRLDEAFNFEVELFFPLSRSGLLSTNLAQHRARNYIGPLLLAGGRWNSDSSEKVIDSRVYGGFRLTFSPENITDVLIGKTGTRDGLRLEARGQGRIATWNNAPLLIGASANVGLDDEGDEEDAIRVYLIWRTNVTSSLSKLVPK